LLKEIVADSF